MIKKYDSHIIAAVCTLVCLVLVFLLLWFLHMTINSPKEEKELVVTFDVMEDPEVLEEEFVQKQESQAAPELGEKPVAVTAKTSPPALGPISTFQSSPEVHPKDTVSSDTKIDFGKIFAETNSSSDKEEPLTTIDDNPVPPGPGGGEFAGGGGWKLEGRGIVSIEQPTVVYNDEFTVVVDITVNAKGAVISAKYSHKGSKGYNPDVVQAAVAKASEAKFTAGEREQRGQITFVFRGK